MLAANELQLLREMLPHTLSFIALSDAESAADWKEIWDNFPPLQWTTPVGYYHFSRANWSVQARALHTLLEPTIDAAAVRAWLPSIDELTRICTFELGWDLNIIGAAHPALLCSALYGRLGDWATATAACEAVLKVALNPFVRTEAHRLLGRCHAATGARTAACEAAESAVAEAARAGYAWMEMRALRELRDWVEPGAAPAVHARLDEAVARLAATPAEIDSALSTDWW